MLSNSRCVLFWLPTALFLSTWLTSLARAQPLAFKSKAVDGVTLSCTLTISSDTNEPLLDVQITNAATERILIKLDRLLIWVKDQGGNEVPLTDKGDSEIGFWTRPLTKPTDIAIRGAAEAKYRTHLAPGEHKSRTLSLAQCFQMHPGGSYRLTIEADFFWGNALTQTRTLRVENQAFTVPKPPIPAPAKQN